MIFCRPRFGTPEEWCTFNYWYEPMAMFNFQQQIIWWQWCFPVRIVNPNQLFTFVGPATCTRQRGWHASWRRSALDRAKHHDFIMEVCCRWWYANCIVAECCKEPADVSNTQAMVAADQRNRTDSTLQREGRQMKNSRSSFHHPAAEILWV